MLLRETETLHGMLDGVLRRVAEEHLGLRKEIHIGISTSISLSHLPGLLHAYVRRFPEVRITVSQQSGLALLSAVAECRLDVGVLCAPKRMPRTVTVTHRMADAFVAVVSSRTPTPNGLHRSTVWRKWCDSQRWLLPPAGTPSRRVVDDWAETSGFELRAAMEIDGFDLMIQLAALELGVALVPRRAVAGFSRKSQIKTLAPPAPLVRELVVLSPNRPTTPGHVRQFIEAILFS
jgi:DNA-binding transcriptional LysR family regulator